MPMKGLSTLLLEHFGNLTLYSAALSSRKFLDQAVLALEREGRGGRKMSTMSTSSGLYQTQQSHRILSGPETDVLHLTLPGTFPAHILISSLETTQRPPSGGMDKEWHLQLLSRHDNKLLPHSTIGIHITNVLIIHKIIHTV